MISVNSWTSFEVKYEILKIHGFSKIFFVRFIEKAEGNTKKGGELMKKNTKTLYLKT